MSKISTKVIFTISIVLAVSVSALVAMKFVDPVFANQGTIAVEPVPTPSGKKGDPREYTFIDGKFDGVKLVRSEAEWRKILTPIEFYIMRQDGTEEPYTGALTKNKKKGTYHCNACGLTLFSSRTKFDSVTGWPSFYAPIHRQNVTEKEDRSIAEIRTEVECARCDAHLGHVFDDGPAPTGLRYCINALSLRFKPAK